MQHALPEGQMEKELIQISYLGNDFIKEDSLAVEICETLKKEYADIVFKKIDTFDQLMFPALAVFMDVCDGVDKVTMIEDIDDLDEVKTSTAHDMDFGFFLKINKALGNLDKVRIICLPKERYEGIESDIKDIIEGLR
jgi:Ni,Fe-hydrogenase maturation factor